MIGIETISCLRRKAGQPEIMGFRGKTKARRQKDKGGKEGSTMTIADGIEVNPKVIMGKEDVRVAIGYAAGRVL